MCFLWSTLLNIFNFVNFQSHFIVQWRTCVHPKLVIGFILMGSLPLGGFQELTELLGESSQDWCKEGVQSKQDRCTHIVHGPCHKPRPKVDKKQQYVPIKFPMCSHHVSQVPNSSSLYLYPLPYYLFLYLIFFTHQKNWTLGFTLVSHILCPSQKTKNWTLRFPTTN